MIDYSDEVKPLTTEEKKWIKKLERALKHCPTRLGLYTVGDAFLGIYDKVVQEKHDIGIEDGGAEEVGIDLGYVRSSVQIEAVSG